MKGNEDESWGNIKLDAEDLGVDEIFVEAIEHLSQYVNLFNLPSI
jgi:hypothetical protein